jgi:hypothetical protein
MEWTLFSWIEDGKILYAAQTMDGSWNDGWPKAMTAEQVIEHSIIYGKPKLIVTGKVET